MGQQAYEQYNLRQVQLGSSPLQLQDIFIASLYVLCLTRTCRLQADHNEDIKGKKDAYQYSEPLFTGLLFMDLHTLRVINKNYRKIPPVFSAAEAIPSSFKVLLLHN